MDFLHASINAALKEATPTQSFDGDDEESGDMADINYENDDSFNGFANSDFSAYSVDDNGGGVTEGDSPQAEDDEQPPVLEESSNALNGLSQVMTAPQAMARAYQEDVIPMEKCHFNGNKFTIDGCKYEFVRLNVRNNIYFRCVTCYAIYQRCRSIASRSNANQMIPSVGSLKLVTSTNEIRGNPDRPSGIAHCCENELYRDAMKNTKANEVKANEALKIINSAMAANGNGVNNNDNEDYIVPLDKCHFLEKRLEIDGCKYVFSRTQSGPRDYYRCSACIALYHKRHFRKLQTPKIGSLSLIRETNVLTGDPDKPRGLPHICDNEELKCAPLRGDGRPKFRSSAPALSQALSGIFEAAKMMNPKQLIWSQQNDGQINGAAAPAPGSLAAIRPPRLDNQPMQMANALKRNIDMISNSMMDPAIHQQKYRKLFDSVVTPVNGNNKFQFNGINGLPNMANGSCNGSASPSVMSNGATRSDSEAEGLYPHTDEVQVTPRLSFPDGDLNFMRRQELWNQVLSQFPNQPKQGRVLIFSDSLLAEFDNKPLNPSTSLIRAAHPVTPSHLTTLAIRAATSSDCFSKTKYIFYAEGYDTLRCLDIADLTRKINIVQNEFLELRTFLDPGCKARGAETVLAFVTIPEIGVLAPELKALNDSMRHLIQSLNRDDVVVCDWAEIYERNQGSLELVQDRLKSLLSQMSTMCGTELLDED